MLQNTLERITTQTICLKPGQFKLFCRQMDDEIWEDLDRGIGLDVYGRFTLTGSEKGSRRTGAWGRTLGVGRGHQAVNLTLSKQDLSSKPLQDRDAKEPFVHAATQNGKLVLTILNSQRIELLDSEEIKGAELTEGQSKTESLVRETLELDPSVSLFVRAERYVDAVLAHLDRENLETGSAPNLESFGFPPRLEQDEIEALTAPFQRKQARASQNLEQILIDELHFLDVMTHRGGPLEEPIAQILFLKLCEILKNLLDKKLEAYLDALCTWEGNDLQGPPPRLESFGVQFSGKESQIILRKEKKFTSVKPALHEVIQPIRDSINPLRKGVKALERWGKSDRSTPRPILDAGEICMDTPIPLMASLREGMRLRGKLVLWIQSEAVTSPPRPINVRFSPLTIGGRAEQLSGNAELVSILLPLQNLYDYAQALHAWRTNGKSGEAPQATAFSLTEEDLKPWLEGGSID